MVDSIDSRPKISGDQSVSAVAAIKRARRPADEPQERAPARTASLAGTTRDMAAEPPVDTDRVARLRTAVKDGSFSVDPTAIADRMLTLKTNWISDDPA